MSEYIIQSETLTGIADAIRAKTGGTDPILVTDMATQISSITGGGSADVRYVTFMNGSVELYKKPVAVGDDCVDVVSKGLIDTPTKESTAQYSYTYYGWGASDGGAADSTILQNITEDKTVYAIFTAAVRYYTITYLDDDGVMVLKTETVAYGSTPTPPTPAIKEGYIFEEWQPAITTVTGNQTYTAYYTEAEGLETLEWSEIAAISAAGTGENYFAVGDTKSVHLNGTMGEITLDATLYVYILGFNHNSTVEGTGIHFGTFKTGDGVDVCLVDSNYGKNSSSEQMRFSMNHWSISNYGGWAGCDLRYDILGSTDVAPRGYGAAVSESRVGYDATSTCATNPVANTLMSCLPADLRAVMKPVTKYTDNKGGATNTEACVTASVDYLPLLAECEVFGIHDHANSYEKNHQQQYAYFAAGNSKVKYRHSDTGTTAFWWGRSPQAINSNRFWNVNNSGSINGSTSYTSFGIAPVFMV